MALNSVVSYQPLFASIPEAARGQYPHQVAVANSTCGVDGYHAPAVLAMTPRDTTSASAPIQCFMLDSPRYSVQAMVGVTPNHPAFTLKNDLTIACGCSRLKGEWPRGYPAPAD